MAHKCLNGRTEDLDYEIGKTCEIVKICGQKKEVGLHHKALELLEYLWDCILSRTQVEIESIITKPWDVIFVATEMGNVEFVTTLLRSYPDLIWKLNDQNQSIFHVAVIHRQEEIFRLIYEIGAIKDLLVMYMEKDTNNSILHSAALKPTSDRLNSISGAALRMQREMLWFKVIIPLPSLTSGIDL
ncbi:Ankyrin repeat-containing protein ITN1 [Bienertia sinuspersici]